jgi:hypothetical protein
MHPLLGLLIRLAIPCVGLLAVWPTSPPAEAAGLREIALGSPAPAYVARATSRTGEQRLRIRVHTEVRSVDFRFAVSDAPSAKENTLTLIELADVSEAGRPERPMFRGKVTRIPDPAAQEKVWRIYTPLVMLKPREQELLWELRLRTVPPKEGEAAPPLEVFLRMEADARPITQREKELMAWRARIQDPLKEIEAVRAKAAELSDEEIRLYTGFQDRATFLKYWGRAKQADFLTSEGNLRVPSIAAALLDPSKSTPLPDGRYLHHNGRLPPLE